MAYDYKKALSSGASEDDVLNYLNTTRGYNVQGALSAGAKKSDLIDYLAKTERPKYPVAPVETKNQFKDYTSNLSSEKPTNGSFGSSEKQRVGFAQKVLGFIGGQKTAEGAGMAIAAPGVQRSLSETQQQQGDLAMKTIQQIRKARAEGRDTTRLEQALQKFRGSMGETQKTQQDFTDAMPTNKEVIGSSLRLGTTLAGGALGRLGAKATALGKATTFMGGVARGAGAGAISGAIGGGAIGTGLGLEANKDTKGIVTSGALGAATGAIGGGILGGVTGGISGALKGKALTKESFVEDYVSPKLNKDERIAAITQGRIKDPTFLKKAEAMTTQRTKNLADATKDIVSPKATLSQNVDAIRLNIDETDDAVRSYIQTHKVPFNQNQLRSTLMGGTDDLELVFASDKAAKNTYNKVVDVFIRNVGNKDTLGLFEGRQAFDQLPAVKKLLDSAPIGENARKEIVLQVRRMANEYIASQLPQGSIYKDAMLKQHYLLEALGNIAEKNEGIFGKNNLQLLAEKYPALKWLVGGVGAGIAGGAGVGVGSAIIGSSE